MVNGIQILQGIRIVPYTRGDLRKNDKMIPTLFQEGTDNGSTHSANWRILAPQNQHLAKIVACPVEMVQNGTLCCVYMDYNNPNRLMANELEAFMESAHRLYES